MPQPLWTPSADRIAATRMTAFRLFINQRHGLALADYPALHAWSVAQREAFWQAIVDFFDIRFSAPATAVLQEGPAMPSAHWFPGATLNFAEQLLRRRDNHPPAVRVRKAFGKCERSPIIHLIDDDCAGREEPFHDICGILR